MLMWPRHVFLTGLHTLFAHLNSPRMLSTDATPASAGARLNACVKLCLYRHRCGTSRLPGCYEELLSEMDRFVAALRSQPAGGVCAERLRTCFFRSWPMLSVYEPGCRRPFAAVRWLAHTLSSRSQLCLDFDTGGFELDREPWRRRRG